MSVFARRLLSFVLLGGLCCHFVLIFIYSSPIKFRSEKIKFVSNYYTYPFFHQSWNLFVPAPKAEFHLYVRYYGKDKWYSWQDVFQTQLNKRRNNPIKGAELKVLLFSTDMNYLSGSLSETSRVYEVEPMDVNFQILKHAVKQYIVNYKCMKKATTFEIIFVRIENKQKIIQYYKNLSLH